MKRMGLTCPLIFMIILLFVVIQGCKRPTNGLVVMEKDRFLGELFQNETREAAFIVSNALHSSGVEILDVQKSCGCTSVRIEGDKVLPPHAATKLIANLTADSRAEHIGAQILLLWRRVNVQESRSSDIIMLKANVVYRARVVPDEMAFGDVLENTENATSSVKIFPGTAATNWDSLAISTAPKELTCKLTKAPDGHYILDGALRPTGMALGYYRKYVELECFTKGRRIGALSVPVSGNVKGDINVQPSYVYFSMGREETIPLKITSRSRTRLRFIEASSTLPGETKIQCRNPSSTELDLLATIDPLKVSASTGGFFNIKIRHKKDYQLSIPFIIIRFPNHKNPEQKPI